MATGERIKFHRNLRKMTQKYLGMSIGFDEKTADVRMAQYEAGTRTPKENLINKIANAFDVSPKALNVPDIDSHIGLMHTLFALEDLYGFQVNSIDGELCLTLDKTKGNTYLSMFEMLNAWHKETAKLNTGDIDNEQYDRWRYNYPKHDTTQHWVKIPSKQLSDDLVKQFKDKLPND